MLGGSELQCDFIATELVRRGYSVSYVAVEGKKSSYDKSYEVIPCHNNPTDIVKKIDESNPDVIYWRFNKNFFYDTIKSFRNKDCIIIFSASSAYDVSWFLYKKSVSFRKNIRRVLPSIREQLGMFYVDAAIVNNQAYLNKLPVKKQVYIPNGMTDEAVPFQWEKPYCAWIANLKKIKRPELYIELAEKLGRDDVDFIMVGDIQEDEYAWIRDKEKLPSNLYYLGPKSFEEVNGILKSSLLHVHTCLAEGFPNVFIQAWILGIPSVSYGFDPSNYITDHYLGYTANEQPDLFVERVRELVDNPQERDELGANAKKFATEMFQIKKSVSELEKLIQGISKEKE